MPKFLLNATLCSVMMGALFGVSNAQQDQNAQPARREEAKKFVELVYLSRQSDGLHKAALASGGTYVTDGFGPQWNMAASLADLVKESKFVVTVRIVSQETRLINGGRGISTFYKFEVISALRGLLRDPALYSIVRPGGTYVYSDKSISVVRAPRDPKLRVGGTYLIFCSPSDGQAKDLYPAFSSQGIFELLDDGVHVRSYSMEPGDQLKIKYDEENQRQLLNDTRDAIAKEANP